MSTTENSSSTSEVFKSLKEDFKAIRKEIRIIKKILEDITIPLEEEANEFIRYLLRQRGVDIETGPTVIAQRKFDVYGTNGVVTVVGEARTRVGENC